MKAPATQLYWKEWVGDMALGRCSLAAQGAWVRILAVLHQSDEYGVLRWPLAELASAANVPLRYARELATKSVLKGSDRFDTDFVHTPRHAGRDLPTVILVKADGGSCWFSARFVRDEWRRTQRGATTRFTETNQPSRSPTGRVGDRQGDGPASAFASASSGIDKSLREDRSQGGADDLARALRGVAGYSECGAFVPELLEAKAAGVTPEQIANVAREKQGKSVAYIARTAIGRQLDKQQQASEVPGAPAVTAVDPEARARADELREIDAKLIDLRHHRDHTGMLSADDYTERAAPLLARWRELQPKAAMGAAS
ncbi:hypothetical protein [Pseudoxanthomonas mexicana]